VNISEVLAETSVSSLDLSRFVSVTPDATVETTVETMAAVKWSCAFIMERSHIGGIFTQRDALQRAIGRPANWQRQITEEMTVAVKTMRDTDSVADGLAIMNDWWVRSVPVLDSNDHVVGNLSYYVVMQAIADIVKQRMADDAVEPQVQHGLAFVDFTGMHTSAPVMVRNDDSLEAAAHQMRARGIGSVVVVDAEDNLVGMLTEFDLFTKLGCHVPDLTAVEVGDVMTKDLVALSARSSVATVIEEMAGHGFSHVPLLGESGRPVAVVSFRDVAGFLETSLAALG
jgi:CBS domain-containing protein